MKRNLTSKALFWASAIFIVMNCISCAHERPLTVATQELSESNEQHVWAERRDFWDEKVAASVPQ